MPAVCVPVPIWALTVMLPPKVNLPSLPSRTNACELMFEFGLLKKVSAAMDCCEPLRSKTPDRESWLTTRLAVGLNCCPLPVAIRMTPPSMKVLPPAQLETAGMSMVMTPLPRLAKACPTPAPVRAPLKVELVLISPKPTVRPVVPVMESVPAPESEPKVSFSAISRIAPLAIVTGTVLPMRSAAGIRTFPAEMISGPSKFAAPAN